MTTTPKFDSLLSQVGVAVAEIKAKHPDPWVGQDLTNAQLLEVRKIRIEAWRAQASEATLLAQRKGEAGESELAVALSEWASQMDEAAAKCARDMASPQFQTWLSERQAWLDERAATAH